MKRGAILVVLCLAGCASYVHRPPEPATHWTRTDDLSEYNGLYVFSQTKDGRLWRTHYPETHFRRPEKPRQIGFWTATNAALTWQDLDGRDPIVFLQDTNGVYAEQDGTYYGPVRLRHVQIEEGRPIVDE